MSELITEGLIDLKKLRGEIDNQEFELKKNKCGDYFIDRIRSQNLFMIYYKNELVLKVWCWRTKDKKRNLVIKMDNKYLISEDLEKFRNENELEINKNFIPSNKNLLIYQDSTKEEFMMMGKRYKGYQIYSSFTPIISFLIGCCIILT
jgi:hypothetical protein